jgi:hypothetical protein
MLCRRPRPQIAKGRVDAIRRLRDRLLSEADAAFPEATAVYRSLAPGLPPPAVAGGAGAGAAAVAGAGAKAERA